MGKIIGKGRVIWLTLNNKPCLHLDDDKGVGFPIEGMLAIEGLLFKQETFTPYLGKVISIIVEEKPHFSIIEEKGK